MKTETTNRKNYEKPSIEVVKFVALPLLMVSNYEGAPGD